MMRVWLKEGFRLDKMYKKKKKKKLKNRKKVENFFFLKTKY
jgi:hypothetical protein